MDYVLFVLGISGLVFGADFIINQSERIALRFNISEFVIGATLIALGTSLPEMAASVSASIEGKPEIAIAGVVGSNIMNITLVLATIFIVSKRFVSDRDFFAKDSIWAIMPILFFLLMSMDGMISRFDAVLLLILMGAYILFLVDDGEGLERDNSIEDRGDFSWIRSIGLLCVGFVLVVVGAHFTVESASSIALDLGVSEWLIGVMLISFGTSLPELIISVSASLRGKVEMAIGNIIGSNLANTTMVLGVAGLVNELPISLAKHYFDISVMTVATLLLIYITANKLYSKSAGISLLLLLALFVEHSIT